MQKGAGVLFCILLYFGSCTCHTQVQCGVGDLGFFAVGYDSAQLDSVVLIQYKPDAAFDSAIDTVARSVLSRYVSADTLYPALDINDFSYDYELIFPNAGLTLRISAFKIIGNTTQNMKIDCAHQENPQCSRQIASINVNGQNVALPPNNNGSYGSQFYTIVK